MWLAPLEGALSPNNCRRSEAEKRFSLQQAAGNPQVDRKGSMALPVLSVRAPDGHQAYTECRAGGPGYRHSRRVRSPGTFRKRPCEKHIHPEGPRVRLLLERIH